MALSNGRFGASRRRIPNSKDNNSITLTSGSDEIKAVDPSFKHSGTLVSFGALDTTTLLLTCVFSGILEP